MKDGFLQIDESPVEFAPLQAIMKIVTIKVGHMEINYGDAHFRRSDNGNALYNPFVGNYIMDAFTTEIGAPSTYSTLWRYDSFAEREERRARLKEDERWQAFLAKVQPLIHTQQNRILVPTPFSPIK